MGGHVQRVEQALYSLLGRSGRGRDALTGRLTRKGTYIIAIGSTHGNADFSMDVKIE